ncbi:IS6 family transposase [Leptolyngbya sp. DQ-M1]|uniref:IS6 family transposase n=1 Tax=Leptolyngbya sp. DQ-M1 TaxID=2933920 RepID=UPI0032982F9E
MYSRHRFPGEIISDCVWLDYPFPLSYRDIEKMMLYRGIEVTDESIREWCQKFGQQYANQLQRKRPYIADKWHLDEVVVTIKGQQYYLWRAVDSEGDVLDVLLQRHRNTKASDGFLTSEIAGATVTLWNAVVDDTVIDLNGAADGLDTTAMFIAGGQPVALANTATIISPSPIDAVLVWIDNVVNGANEVLAVNTTGTSLQAQFYESGELLITGEGSAADYQKVLQTLTYANKTAVKDLDPRQRSILVALNNENGYSDAAEVRLSIVVA